MSSAGYVADQFTRAKSAMSALLFAYESRYDILAANDDALQTDIQLVIANDSRWAKAGMSDFVGLILFLTNVYYYNRQKYHSDYEDYLSPAIMLETFNVILRTVAMQIVESGAAKARYTETSYELTDPWMYTGTNLSLYKPTVNNGEIPFVHHAIYIRYIKVVKQDISEVIVKPLVTKIDDWSVKHTMVMTDKKERDDFWVFVSTFADACQTLSASSSTLENCVQAYRDMYSVKPPDVPGTKQVVLIRDLPTFDDDVLLPHQLALKAILTDRPTDDALKSFFSNTRPNVR